MGWAASLQAGESAYVATLVRAHPKLDDYRDILWDWANHTYDWGAIRTQLAKRLSSDLSQAELDSITTLYTASNRSKLEKTWSQELRVLTAYMAELETQLGTQYWPELRRKLRERATELHKADPLQSD